MTSIIWLIAVFLLASNWPLSPCSITTSALRLSGKVVEKKGEPNEGLFSFQGLLEKGEWFVAFFISSPLKKNVAIYGNWTPHSRLKDQSLILIMHSAT